MDYPKKVSIFEVGPRDGFQNEPDFIPTEKKIEFINMLTKAGCRRIEVTSFVNPKWVPQMKDAKEVFARIEKKEGITYNALVPNMKGLELAIETGLKEVVTIMSSSESHNKKNINMTVAESLKEIEKINKVAAEHGVRVRSYIATSFGCPIEGDIPVEKVVEIASALEEYGSYEISLGDTTGMANPIQAYIVPSSVICKVKRVSVAVHYHRSQGIEFANNLASLQAGIKVFDGAAGGLGGCPYAPGATGNTATETLVQMFERMGIATDIDVVAIKQCGEYAKRLSALCKISK
ncbi:MAG TPA: hydroxymethylglutaryl-CoA lyase [Firmicutes bacterium]|nr:hydroxymethylglutaryl-CoA lyase [Bacillota bacterium]